jgi:phosphomannomutase
MQVRLSGTEPVIRIASEARTDEKADELFATVEDIVRRGL